MWSTEIRRKMEHCLQEYCWNSKPLILGECKGGKYERIILVNEVIQAIVEKNCYAKFKENLYY